MRMSSFETEKLSSEPGTNFNYKLGINAFHYPKFFSGIKADLEFSVTYNF